MAVDHYENFPVASVLLPARLRRPVALIYRFAREADDFADEGEDPPEIRLRNIGRFSAQLDLLEQGRPPGIAWFTELGQIIDEHRLSLTLFRDLLSAFAQDVTVNRYPHHAAVMDYCRRSANPVGRLLLALFRRDSEENLALSDHVCSSLQIINFLQDVAIDWKKDRVYLPLDEMQAAGITEQDIATGESGPRWQAFMLDQCDRALRMMQAGAPLGRILGGRIGLEIRLTAAGGTRILEKIRAVDGDVYRQRPVLKWHDWPRLLTRAI